jgi:deazaflavin-dependent oxidoreductase (nitroreductase family)
MPLSRRLAVFNKHVTNRITRPIAGWAPGFGVVHHVGRKTGREYETPVNVFRGDNGYVIALTYGGGSWVRNVLAAGGCSLETRGHTIELRDPKRYTDHRRTGIPTPVRWILGLLDVDEFISLQTF